MARIEMTTIMAAPIESVFDACLNVDLHAASMRGNRERVLHGPTTGQLSLGDAVTLKAWHFGLPWRMTSEITELVRPQRFTDQQTNGPFAHWRHEHVFVADMRGRNATVMHDIIDFAAPAGLLGKAVSAIVLRPHLQRLIQNRNTFIAGAFTDK